MAQTIPLSQRAVETVEVLIDMFHQFMQDGRLCAREHQELTTQMREAHRKAMEVDEAQSLSVSMMRNGPGSQRTKRLTRQFIEDHAA